MARFALEPPLNGLPLVLDMVDVDSMKWRALGETAAIPARWVYATEARRLSVFEATAARQAGAVLVVNDRERESLLQVVEAYLPSPVVALIPPRLESQQCRTHMCASAQTYALTRAQNNH